MHSSGVESLYGMKPQLGYEEKTLRWTRYLSGVPTESAEPPYT